MAVAKNPDRPMVYRHHAKGTAEGTLTFCVRTGDPQERRRVLEEQVQMWETHTPTPQELKELNRAWPEDKTGPLFPTPEELEARRRSWRRRDALRRWVPAGSALVAAASAAVWWFGG